MDNKKETPLGKREPRQLWGSSGLRPYPIITVQLTHQSTLDIEIFRYGEVAT